MRSHSVTCHLTEVILTPLSQCIAGTDLIGWLYQDGFTAHRRSPIQVLTGPDVE